jgi:hypothetical protein
MRQKENVTIQLLLPDHLIRRGERRDVGLKAAPPPSTPPFFLLRAERGPADKAK